jgi:hypothetical protein
LSPPVSVFFTEEAGSVTAEKVEAALEGGDVEVVVADVEVKEEVSLP